MQQENPTAETWLEAHREQIQEEGSVEVDVYVRSLSPPLGTRQRQEKLFKRLQELQAEGVIDSYRVNLWGGGVCLCDVCSGTGIAQSMLDRVEEFEQWASDRAVSLPFERKSVESSVLQQTSDDLVVPSICLGIYNETEVQGVVPCEVDGETVSVSDYVEAIAGEMAFETESADNTDPIAQI